MRETDTLDTFVQSSWYQLRFSLNPDRWNEVGIDKTEANYWLGVDQYVGGIEHAILHLLYARFFTKVLRDMGYHDRDEPFGKLLTQGMVLMDGAKMSKSKGNTVDPDDLVARYGADTARLFILFAAPPQKELEWNDSAVDGAFRFVRKLYDRKAKVTQRTLPAIDHSSLAKESKLARIKVYEALQKSAHVYEKSFAFNTLIAACMEALNALDKQDDGAVWSEGMYVMLNLLEPIIPHIANELSQELFERENLSAVLVVKEEVFVQESILYMVMIGGKKRAEVEVEASASQAEILEAAKYAGAKWLEGMQIVKEIVVPNKLVNLAVKPNA